ncbi:hypothetical protein IQ238_21075 [Pleurocapsales cyanobacterium LEGE 06147]|nr:hypothetical protein [Pleurocapsales cyanobacterium LEGE 06147]
MIKKVNLLSAASLLSLLALIPFLTTPKVNACATTDVLTQVAIRGSQQPATQSGKFNQSSDGNCLGNSVTGTTTQLYVGADPVEQTYEGNQFVGGGEFNQTGVSSPVIQTPVHVPVDVYSPAHDPNFFGF